MAAGLLGPALAGARPHGQRVSLSRADAEALDRVERPRRLGLFVGVDRYDDPAFHALRYPSTDAASLAAAYVADGETGPGHVEVLTGAGATTRAGILAALDRLAERNTRPDDVVFVAFSGHGTLARDPAGAIVPVLVAEDTQARARVYDTGVPVEAIVARLQRLRSRRKVTLLAACHNGEGKSWVEPALRREVESRKGSVTPLQLASEASVLLFAAAPGQVALEDDGLGGDVYIHYFVEAFDRGDHDRDGAVSVTEAHEYAAAHTFERTHRVQVPLLRGDIVGLDPIYLRHTPTKDGLPIVYSYEPDAQYLTLLVNGQVKGTFPGEFVLPVGEHEVAVAASPDAPPLRTARVWLAPGDRATLADVLAPRWTAGVALGASAPVGASADLLGGLEPALTAGLTLDDTAWGRWRPLAGLSLSASDQRADDAGPDAFRLESAVLYVGAAWSLLARGPFEAAVEASVGARGTRRRFGDEADAAIGPAGGLGLSASYALSGGLAATAAAGGEAGWLPTDDDGVAVTSLGARLGLAWRWRSGADALR